MKKNFLLLLTLLCSVTFFTACSDDDEDNSWKELPNGEIKADKVDMKLNGETTTGTVNFTATSLEAAKLDINNVIDGYSDISVDLKMSKQQDGSFKLNGTYETSARPVSREAQKIAPILTVIVDGTITADGKLTVNISTAGPGLYIGTYKGETLALSYGETALIGKEVIFDATDGKNISILLKDVIPGEAETTLSGIKLNNDGFTGSTETSNASIDYTGSRINKILTLKLDIKMKDPLNIAKSYAIGEYTTGTVEVNGQKMQSAVLSGALYMNWTAIDPDSQQDNGAPFGFLFRGIGGSLLPQLLRSVTLNADGNIGAEYVAKPTIAFDMNLAMAILSGYALSAEEIKKLIPAEGWEDAPRNLAYWYEKDGKIYVKLNISTIIAQATGNSGADFSEIISMVLNGDAATIKALLANVLKIDFSSVSDETFTALLSWVKDGFPMSVKAENGHTYMYLDKDAFDPIFKLRKTPEGQETSDLMQLWSILSEANMIPEDYQMAGLLLGAFSGYWSITTEFAIGLDLQAK